MLPVVSVMGRAPNKDMNVGPYMIPAGVCVCVGGGGIVMGLVLGWWWRGEGAGGCCKCLGLCVVGWGGEMQWGDIKNCCTSQRVQRRRCACCQWWLLWAAHQTKT